MERAISILRREINKDVIVLKNVKEPLKTVAQEARLHGLSSTHFQLLLRLFRMPRIRGAPDPVKHSTVWVMALNCMLPRQKLEEREARLMLVWIAKHSKNGPVMAVALALQWIAGLLKYELIEERIVDIFYKFFFDMMSIPQYVATAAWLVQKLTKPHDVTRPRVEELLHVRRQLWRRKNIIDIVLWLYKIYKPECVPEPVSARSVSAALRLKDLYREHFERLQSHLDGLARERVLSTEYKWEVIGDKKRQKIALIPGVYYVHYGSSRAREKKTPVLELKEWQAMIKGQLNPDYPCNATTLLQNPLGHHLIAFGDKTLQHRLSHTLYNTLHSVFIERNQLAPFKEEENLLEQLCQLQEYMLQGLPITGRFLGLYLPSWDGTTHFKRVMRLIHWVPVTSFEELEMCILRYLYMVFMTSDVTVKCNILRALGNLATNLMLFPTNENSLFVYFQPVEDQQTIVARVNMYIQELCMKGLIVENADSVLLTNILLLHHQLAEAEERCNLSVWSVVPPLAMYSSLFSPNYAHLEGVARLLFRYKQTTYPRLRELYPRIDFIEELKLLENYIHDFMNLLWLRKAFSGRKKGYIFRQLSDRSVYIFRRIMAGEEAFDALRHPTLRAAGSEVRRRSFSSELTQPELISALRVIAPGIHDLTTMFYRSTRLRSSNVELRGQKSRSEPSTSRRRSHQS